MFRGTCHAALVVIPDDQGMDELKNSDPCVSTEAEVEVNAETAAAIEKGLKDAKEGRVVPANEVHQLIPQWISKFSIPKQP
jgi:predicted transcriptional regulator